jgi:dienelactone hydrolase
MSSVVGLPATRNVRVGHHDGGKGRVMASAARFVRMAAAAACMAAACGRSGGDQHLTVTSRVISDPTTQDIRVLAPEAKGNWPVVVALHGLNGSGRDMVELATRVARAGSVVFVPTYHSDLRTTDDLIRASDDLACAYPLARRTAPDYGGDLGQPVTAVGWSLGADFVLLGSLQGPDGEADTGRCPGQVPRPDVVVGLSGCYYEFDAKPVSWFDDMTGWANKDAEIRLVDGDRDTTCPGWQTEKLAAALRDAGYQGDVTGLDGANHVAPVFHDMRNGQWQVITDNAPGERTVQVIVDAIAAARDTPSTD